MREMTMKVLRPWKQHGGHPLPLLASQGGKSKDSHYHKGVAMEMQPHLYLNDYLLQWLPTRASSHKHTSSSEGFNLLLFEISFFLSFFFPPSLLSFLPLFHLFWEKRKNKKKIEAVSNCTLSLATI